MLHRTWKYKRISISISFNGRLSQKALVIATRLTGLAEWLVGDEKFAKKELRFPAARGEPQISVSSRFVLIKNEVGAAFRWLAGELVREAEARREAFSPSARQTLIKKLNDGRRRTAQKCEQVAAALAKEAGVRQFEYVRGLWGRAFFADRRIRAPRPVTRRSLYIWAHECAHIALNHGGRRKSTHRQEFEAERWAIDALHRHGVAVPRKSIERAKAYVRLKIDRARRRRAKRIDAEAAAWAASPTP